jgi:hypothetical protein
MIYFSSTIDQCHGKGIVFETTKKVSTPSTPTNIPLYFDSNWILKIYSSSYANSLISLSQKT